jgi:hypothetical protein
MQIIGDEMGGGLLPRPRKVDPSSFVEAAKLVTIDIRQGKDLGNAANMRRSVD